MISVHWTNPESYIDRLIKYIVILGSYVPVVHRVGYLSYLRSMYY